MNLDRRTFLGSSLAVAAQGFLARAAAGAGSWRPSRSEQSDDGGDTPRRHALHFDTPVTVWDEALPLGNGLFGALVWGDGRPLRISLDRTDLWDLRPVPQFESEDYSYARMREWVRDGRLADLHRLYDDPYGNAGPTKIPAGRIELTLDGEPVFQETSLELRRAVAEVKWKDGPTARVRVHATRPVGWIELAGAGAVEAKLIAPAFGGEVTDPAAPGKISAGDLASLGYGPPEVSGGEDWTGYLQEGWDGFRFAVVLVWRREGERWLGVWSSATSEDGEDPRGLALARCREALGEELAELAASHERWWGAYWGKSSIQLPNPVLERQWRLETYKFGSAARGDTPPITLQGPWTADNGKIPPWKGDYHHDLNTELSYWPCYSGNRLEGGLGFVDWLWKTREESRAWTRRFFDLPGLNVPMTADLEGRQIGGWHQYTHSATCSAWLAHHFWLHWRYSMDPEFLRERAWPYLQEVAVFLEAITEQGEDGKRTLPLSSSPEVNDNRLEAWFPSITNYDLALIRWVFQTAAELAGLVGDEGEAKRWARALGELPEYALDAEDGRLLVAAGHPLEASHRHFSHLMAIHPLGMIRWEGGDEDRRTIRAALAEQERLGTDWWTGYSFAWQASLAARARDGELAEQALEIFSTAFCLRNSFHCNGDQSGKGYSKFRYRPFTLEGNFAAAAGVQEMLIQSYSGVVRVFPAIPESWADVSFEQLRAEGAFLVSAARKGGLTRRVELVAERGGVCRLEDPFAGAELVLEGIEPELVERTDGELRFETTAGQRIVLTRKR